MNFFIEGSNKSFAYLDDISALREYGPEGHLIKNVQPCSPKQAIAHIEKLADGRPVSVSDTMFIMDFVPLEEYKTIM